MYVLRYTHTWSCAFICTFVFIQNISLIYIYMYNIYIYIHVYIYTYIYIYVYIYIRIYVDMYVYIYIPIYQHVHDMYIYICKDTCIHASMRQLSLSSCSPKDTEFLLVTALVTSALPLTREYQVASTPRFTWKGYAQTPRFAHTPSTLGISFNWEDQQGYLGNRKNPPPLNFYEGLIL